MNTNTTDRNTARSFRPARASRLGATVLCSALAVALAPVPEAQATPSMGVTPRLVAFGVLPEPVRTKLKDEGGFGDGTAVENLSLVEFTVAPGGYFGWHVHGGPVWVMVKQGTLTLYDANDRTCTGTPYQPGSALLDGGNHVHNARNEGQEPVVIYATFMLPEGGQLRIDAPDPGVCPF